MIDFVTGALFHPNSHPRTVEPLFCRRKHFDIYERPVLRFLAERSNPLWVFFNYTVSQKTRHLTLAHNFTKY